MKKWEAAYLAGIIDGEGSITLTRMHQSEHRRPCITIASTDKELLVYVQTLTNGVINNKKNYNPIKHKNSYTLNIKKKEDVFSTLLSTAPYLRIPQKRNRAHWILDHYNEVTQRNGKYNKELMEKKLLFEEPFFRI
ncbi:LAGLIDADG family homing endonuclease [Alkalihalobacillus sp. AL-G]|uniref:LAGLIDADG family homing endonuclease n=1 Tax=Alkalihalobacillus sp. AL-G TaxID=2926399 RepID=UPI00272C6BEB|nr:LAGLIDADG family homing endonuclease [Alkalihalobacillus sp. AL-G]WLD92880.1 LAGLIDADG family homing endonuclease [Alkalihalobacillus sp. AL-G]